MIVRFLADEDIRANIVESVRSREPAIDIVDAKTAGLRGITDFALLELAADENRILISHDRNTMTRHFRERLAAGKPSPGLFIVPQHPGLVGEIVDSLLLIWTISEADERHDRIVWLPFR